MGPKRKVLTEKSVDDNVGVSKPKKKEVWSVDKTSKPKKSGEKKQKGKIDENSKIEEVGLDILPRLKLSYYGYGRRLNNNFLNLLYARNSGFREIRNERFVEAATKPIIRQVSRFGISHLASPFEARITALAWHPGHQALAGIGSKWGDIILWDLGEEQAGGHGQRVKFKNVLKGRGPGGSIQSLKFDELEAGRVYTASIDGFVARHDFERGEVGRKVYLATNDWEKWYTGLDVSFSGRMVVAGSNSGKVSLLSLEGEHVWEKKLHKSKCNFVQFSERQPWMMVTSTISTGSGAGGSVKVWDIRRVSDASSSLAELVHDKAVNSAVFSPVAGDKLLTTDQHSQIRIYQAPSWRLLKVIQHPHRQFQHLTPIKAAWHPLADIPFAGRYPDPNFADYQEGEKRSIDFFCPLSGECLLKLHQPGFEKIISLSTFNRTGDFLLSGGGGDLLVWRVKPGQECLEDEEHQRDVVVKSAEESGVHYWPDFSKKKTAQRKKKKTTETSQESL